MRTLSTRCWWAVVSLTLANGCIDRADKDADASSIDPAVRYREMLEFVEKCDRVEVVFGGDFTRIGPFVVTEPATIAALKKEMRRASELSTVEEKMRFIGARNAENQTFLTWVRTKPVVRCIRARLSGSASLAFPDSEECEATLPDERLYREIAKCADEHAARYPTDVLRLISSRDAKDK